jgi:hypothetical protein
MDLRGLSSFLIKTVIRSAVDSGVDVAARRGKAPEDMTQAERQEAARARTLAGKARKYLRIVRRLRW